MKVFHRDGEHRYIEWNQFLPLHSLSNTLFPKIDLPWTMSPVEMSCCFYLPVSPLIITFLWFYKRKAFLWLVLNLTIMHDLCKNKKTPLDHQEKRQFKNINIPVSGFSAGNRNLGRFFKKKGFIARSEVLTKRLHVQILSPLECFLEQGRIDP